jgi:LmbE family N-acetylglucosaminyl deacetylase
VGVATAPAAGHSRTGWGRARARRLFMGLAVVVACGLWATQLQASPPLRVEDFRPIGLDGLERLLVIAPHPDDETLGAGGLIQAALAHNAEVRVVIVTNGDGQWAGPTAINGRVRPRPEDYVAMGHLRQAEALAALRQLGVRAQQVTFLGYPDGALEKLWRDDWTTACPLRARWTRATTNPYANASDSTADYCGPNLLSALRHIAAEFAPQLVVVPHPADSHPDHRTTAAFARLALALAHQAASDFAPAVWGYLVHHGDFPQPRGWRVSRPLLPPARLIVDGTEWQRYDLTDEQITSKAAAVRAHATQMRLLDSFLPSFVRRNEMFVWLPLTDVPRLEWQILPEGVPIAWHTLAEPARDSASSALLQGSDLVSIQVARAGDQLWLTAITRGRLMAGLQYQLLVKTPDGQTLTMRLPEHALRTSPVSFTAQVDLAALNHPLVLALAAEVKQGPTLDRTAWHMLALDPVPLPMDLAVNH